MAHYSLEFIYVATCCQFAAFKSRGHRNEYETCPNSDPLRGQRGSATVACPIQEQKGCRRCCQEPLLSVSEAMRAVPFGKRTLAESSGFAQPYLLGSARVDESSELLYQRCNIKVPRLLQERSVQEQVFWPFRYCEATRSDVGSSCLTWSGCRTVELSGSHVVQDESKKLCIAIDE